MSYDEEKLRGFWSNLNDSEKTELKITLAAQEHIQKLGLLQNTPKLMSFKTVDGRKAQRNGIDSIINYKNSGIEVKHRYELDWYNKDILLETISIISSNKRGWIYTSQADFIAYVWMKNILEPLPIGYLIHLPEFKKTRIFNHLKTLPERKAHSENEKTGAQWYTLNRELKIGKFPEKTLYQFNPTKIEKKETKLGFW